MYSVVTVYTWPNLLQRLNDLDILSGDIQNAYLNAPKKEKLFFYAGDEWKLDQGKVLIIVRAIYGLKSSVLAWSNHLSETLGNHLISQSSLADTNFGSRRQQIRPGMNIIPIF